MRPSHARVQRTCNGGEPVNDDIITRARKQGAEAAQAFKLVTELRTREPKVYVFVDKDGYITLGIAWGKL